MRRVRQMHLWLGIFFSPLIIFFAFSGALQTLSLHEGTKSGSYAPPAWIVRLANIHKDQRLAHGPGTSASLPFKWLVVLMAAGLIVTSLLGIYMAFKFHRDRRLIWGSLAAGIALPIVLLLCR